MPLRLILIFALFFTGLTGCATNYSKPYRALDGKTSFGWDLLAEKGGLRYERATSETPLVGDLLKQRFTSEGYPEFTGFTFRLEHFPSPFAGSIAWRYSKENTAPIFRKTTGTYSFQVNLERRSYQSDYIIAFVEEYGVDRQVINRYLDTRRNGNCWGCSAAVNTEDPDTGRKLSLLPYAEFQMVEADEFRQALKAGKRWDPELFFTWHSLPDALRARGLASSDITLPVAFREDVGYVTRGQGLSALFLTDYLTNETVVYPGWSDNVNRGALIRLPSTPTLLDNAQQAGNGECFGTEKIMVLVGNCDRESPVFPLVALRNQGNNQLQMEIWESALTRSVFVLTRGYEEATKQSRWTAEAFLDNQPLALEQSMAILSGETDPFAASLARFADARIDEKECARFATTVKGAQRELQEFPDVNSLVDNYQDRIRYTWSDNDAYEDIRYDRSPERDFSNLVAWPLKQARDKTTTQIGKLKPYRTLNNDLCSADEESMNTLVAALEAKNEALSEVMRDLERDLGDQSRRLSKTLRRQKSEIEAAKTRAAYAAALGALRSSFQQQLDLERQHMQMMNRYELEAQRGVQRQIEEVRRRQAEYARRQQQVETYVVDMAPVEPIAPPARTIEVSPAMKTYQPNPNLGRCVIDFSRPQDDLMVCAGEKDLQTSSAGRANAGQSNSSDTNVNAGTQVVAGTAGSAIPASGEQDANPPAKPKGDGGAAVCVGAGKNSAGNTTDIEYFMRWSSDWRPIDANSAARKDHREKFSNVPHCRRSINLNSGFVMVIQYDSEKDGAKEVDVAVGFGPTLTAAENDAVGELRRRNWNWVSEDGYRVIETQPF